jgi:membrane-associated HD superfamily phosphohydrolase
MMMADAVEAASRSLPNHTEQSINNLVDQIIDTQMAEGLYADSPISFKDIKIVKDTFKKRLATIYHSRVTYPELNSDE